MCGCPPTAELIDRLQSLPRSEGRHTYNHTFVTCVGTYEGKVQEVNDEFLVVRVEEDYRQHRDVHIRHCCLCAISEYYSGE